jgi:hypothetical protein
LGVLRLMAQVSPSDDVGGADHPSGPPALSNPRPKTSYPDGRPANQQTQVAKPLSYPSGDAYGASELTPPSPIATEGNVAEGRGVCGKCGLPVTTAQLRYICFPYLFVEVGLARGMMEGHACCDTQHAITPRESTSFTQLLISKPLHGLSCHRSLQVLQQGRDLLP